MNDRWLARPATVRLLWRVFLVVLAFVVLAELLVHRHLVIGIDGVFGFSAVYGFASCVVLVFFAKALGFLLKRPDDYYDR